ncbi:terminase [Actinomadura sp. WMMA1423]|uniref:terminase n=1 Tax=Actinomadura sp. WMMA1423 TaxID=2591108 RepID=UPI00114749FA|nr:terminase [Actinomadura sp. WMMA1423]
MSLRGARRPRLRTVPAYERTWGADVRDLAGLAGLDLDEWQADVLNDFTAESPTAPRQWNSLENVLIVGRQNGKGGALEAYVLACLFLFDDPLILFSAHQFDTAREMFLRIQELIMGCPDLSRRVRKVSEAHGKEGILLRSGQRLLFKARSDKSARGFSGDKTILDEAFKLDAAMMGAIMPTMSARPNPQIVYASSQGWEISEQLGKLRHRALAAICARHAAAGEAVEGIAERLGLAAEVVGRYLKKGAAAGDGLAFLEWSLPDDHPRVKGAMADPRLWAQANPAYGIRLTERFVAAELRTMGAVEFARERLGISDYPPDEEDEGGWEVITEQQWGRQAVQGEGPRPGDEGARRPAFSVDMTPDRSMAAIGAAFRDEGGALVLEVIAHEAGSTWVVPRVVDLCERYEVAAVAVDKGGPASSLIRQLEDAGIEVMSLGSGEVAQAYGQVVDGITDSRDVVHLDQEPLNDAVKGATDRPLGDRKTWDRRGDADICPLVAVTNAAYAHNERGAEDDDPLNDIW